MSDLNDHNNLGGDGGNPLNNGQDNPDIKPEQGTGDQFYADIDRFMNQFQQFQDPDEHDSAGGEKNIPEKKLDMPETSAAGGETAQPDESSKDLSSTSEHYKDKAGPQRENPEMPPYIESQTGQPASPKAPISGEYHYCGSEIPASTAYTEPVNTQPGPYPYGPPPAGAGYPPSGYYGQYHGGQPQGYNPYAGGSSTDYKGPAYGPYPGYQSPPFQAQPKKKRNVGLAIFCIVLGVVVLSTLALGILNMQGNQVNPLFPDTSSRFFDTSSIAPDTESSNPPSASDFTGDNSVGITLEDIPSESEALLTATEVASRVTPSVVGIRVYSLVDQEAISEATGIIISSDGYIVTNDHIYSEIPDPQFVVTVSGGKEYEGKFVAGDLRSDLAVIKVEANNLTPARFGNSTHLQVGQSVMAIGNPGGMMFADTATMGIVSAVDRRISSQSSYSMKVIQTDTAINPGNSGGPLVNMYGQVVGINSSKIVATGYEGIGFAIPSTTAKDIVENLIKNGYIADRAKLGITYQEIDTVLSKQNNIPVGLYIQELSSESNLSEKGVKSGDIITKVNGEDITSSGVMLDIIEDSKPGDVLKLTIYNSETGQYSDYDATLIGDRGSSSYTTEPVTSQ